MGIQFVFDLGTSGGLAYGSSRRRLFLLVAMEPKLKKTGPQHVGCSCKKRVRMIVSWRKRTQTIRAEIRLLPPPLAGEQDLDASS